MKKYLYLSFILFIPGITKCQTWAPLANGVNGLVQSIISYKGDLYAAGEFTAAGTAPAKGIAKWDGASWSPAGTGLVSGYERGVALAVFNNDLYVGGEFDSAGGIYMGNIAKWDGQNWSALGSGMNANVICFALFNGELYAAGAFTTAGGVPASYIAKWNGSSWSALTSGVNSFVSDLCVFNGSLYVSGSFSIAGGMAASGIARWDGTSWTQFGSLGGNVMGLESFNGELYASVNSNPDFIKKWDGFSWVNLSGAGTNLYPTAMTSFNGSLYVSGGFNQAGGLPVTGLAKFNGNTWSSVGAGMSGYCRAFYPLLDRLYLGGLIISAGGVSMNNIGSVVAFTNRVKGKLYLDDNSNCIVDVNDYNIARRIITAQPGSYYTMCNKTGDYEIDLDSGSYTITPATIINLNSSCPSAGNYAVSFNGQNDSAVARDFGYTGVNACADLEIDIAAELFRTCRSVPIVVTAKNIGSKPDTVVSVIIDLPQDFAFTSSDIPEINLGNNRYQFNIGTLFPFQSVSFTVTAFVDCNAVLGTVECIGEIILNSITECDTLNNTAEECDKIRSSLDPNDKQVASQNPASNGYVNTEIITASDDLTYMVRFQNTGNDTAFTVIVLDTLSPLLDLSSIDLLGASHPYTFSIISGNVLKWEFADILLPDSNINELESHGFFKYSVKQNPNNLQGSQILNTAAIYFDFNDPVITNTTVNTIGTVGVHESIKENSFSVYPNPANHDVTIMWNAAEGRMRSSQILSVKVVNLLGKEIYTTLSASSLIKVPTASMVEGVYFILLESGNTIHTRKLIIQH